jgi:transposase
MPRSDANDIFTTVLRLKEPWFVESVEAEPDLVTVRVSVRMGTLVRCPVCGTECKVKDRVERTWRHTDVCDSECLIRAGIPRANCPKCGVKQIDIPWARPNVGFTESFERKAVSLMRHMPVSKAAEAMGVGRWVLEGILEYHVSKALDRMDLSGVRRIMIDETSSKRGHRYITVITNADNGNIIFMAEGRGADVLKQFSERLVSRNGDPHGIKWVSSDLSISFMSGLEEYFPHANIVYDRFHLAKMANTALDKIRSKNQKNGQRHKWIRFVLLRNGANLSDEEREKIFDIKEDNAVIGKAYEMKEALMQLYDYPDLFTAGEHIRQWLDWVEKEGEAPMKDIAKTVSEHRNKILNWYHNGMSNGFLEGLNGMIQTTKRIARGYSNMRNFITMIYFRHGRLDMDI